MADENNIGASRLLGTNGLQQAVDSLTTQVNKLNNSINNVSTAFNNMSGSAGRTTGGSQSGNNWNASSNRNNYSGNGGGARFSGGGRQGGGNNGGGGVFSGLSTRLNGMPNGGRAAATVGGAAAVMGGLTAYGNKYMSTNMQMNMFGSQAAVMGGGGYAGSVQAQRAAFTNNNIALSAQDATAAAYINQSTFGFAQFNGRVNPAFARGMAQANAFGYASPTMGAQATARAAAETYTARGFYASQALGIASPFGQGGVRTNMSDIAQSIYRRTFGQLNINQQQLNASLLPGQSLRTNLNYIGNQMGWSSDTTQMYQNYIQGMVTAQSKGMSRQEFASLAEKASQQDKGAMKKLQDVTSLGASMFEKQRNLNATRLNRQENILESLAPAFNDATDAVNKFSEMLNGILKGPLGQMVGTGAGWGSAFSSSVSGFGGAFGAAGGLMTAARLFGGGRGGFGGLGGMFRGFGGFGGGGGGAAGGMINATRGASGAFNITSLGNAGMAAQGGGLLARGGAWGAAAAAVGGSAWLGWNSANHDKGGSIGDVLRMTALTGSPLGAAAMWAGYGRRAYDKWWTGKNQESFWSLLNPLGHEKRTTSTDGRAGGGSNANSGGGGGSPANGSNSNNGATAAQVLKFAESQLGVPYVWGGTTPGKGLDCSGLVQWAYGQAGVKLPRVSQDQAHSGSPVPVNQVQPGDLLFKGDPATHVAIAMGGGKLLEAPRTGLNVRIRGYSAGEFTSARRVLGSVGNTDSLLNGNTDNAQNTNTLNNQQSRSGGNVGNLGGTSEASVVASALGSIMAALPISSKSRSSGATSGTDQLGTPGTANGGTGGNDKASLQAYAKSLLAKYGWGNQWNDFDALVMSESSWDVHATNKSSGAYGLPQALPGSKMKSAGADWQTSGDTQLRWMMDYIKERYGSPSNAWSFHKKNNWYAAGAWSIDKDQTATVHQGEMIIPAKQAESIRQVLLNNSYNPGMQKSGGSGGGITIGSIQVNLPAGWTGTRQDAQMAGRAIMDALVQDKRLKELQRGQ